MILNTIYWDFIPMTKKEIDNSPFLTLLKKSLNKRVI